MTAVVLMKHSRNKIVFAQSSLDAQFEIVWSDTQSRLDPIWIGKNDIIDPV